MKKIFVLVLCFGLLFLAACSNTDTTTSESSEIIETTTEENSDLSESLLGEWKQDIDYPVYITFDADGAYVEGIEDLPVGDTKATFVIQGTYELDGNTISWPATTVDGQTKDNVTTLDGHTLTDQEKEDLNLNDYFSAEYDNISITDNQLIITRNNQKLTFTRDEEVK